MMLQLQSCPEEENTLEIERPEEKLYDLFLLGLWWLRQDSPNEYDRRGASVFASLHHAAGALGPIQRAALQSWDLAEYVTNRSTVLRVETRSLTPDEKRRAAQQPSLALRKEGAAVEVPRRELRRLIQESELHNVILARQGAEMSPELLFGPDGHRHVITDVGMAYAAEIADRYADIITQDSFLDGWGQYKRQLARLFQMDKRRGAEEQT